MVVGIVTVVDGTPRAAANEASRASIPGTRSLDRVLVVVAVWPQRDDLLTVAKNDAVAIVRKRTAGLDQLQRCLSGRRQRIDAYRACKLVRVARFRIRMLRQYRREQPDDANYRRQPSCRRYLLRSRWRCHQRIVPPKNGTAILGCDRLYYEANQRLLHDYAG